MVTEKYRLHRQPPVDGGAKCAFFFSSKGCRNGSTCKFLHTNPTTTTSSSSANMMIKSKDDVSSESSDENLFKSMPYATNSTAVMKQEQDPKLNASYSETHNKRKSPSPSNTTTTTIMNHNNNNNNNNEKNNSMNSIFAPTKPSINQTMKNTSTLEMLIQKSTKPVSSSYAQKGSNHMSTQHVQDTTKTSLFVVSPPAAKKLKSSSTSTTTKLAVKEEMDELKVATNFRQLALPVTSFSVTKKEVSPSHTTTATSTSTKNKSTMHHPSFEDGNSDGEITEFFFPLLPIPKAPESLKWKEACLKSRAHSKYHSSYNFDKYKIYEVEHGIPGAWIKTNAYGTWCRTNPQVIAIDCEMCETTCPLTGKIDGKALCRFSVINVSNPEDILIDTLVKPDWPISDCRTRIHGIELAHLQSVDFTLRHAQAFMMALCSEETVIVGHAVHNDLVALKMEHYCIADSSFLFEIKDEPGVCPSLRDVAMRILSLEMPEIHDSVNDARISLKCLEDGYMKMGGNPNPIERFYPPRDRSGTKSNTDSSLLVHRIPKICKVNHLQQLFLSQTSIQPQEIPEIEFSADKGKVNITFQSPAHAKLAFECISGTVSRDKGDKLQKKVYLKNGDYIVVRENCISKPQEVNE